MAHPCDRYDLRFSGYRDASAVTHPVRNEIRQTLVLIVGAAVTAALSLMYQVVAGRALGPAQYADFAAALSLIYLGLATAGPINATLARFSAEYAAAGELGKIRGLAGFATRRLAIYGLIVGAIALIVLRPLARTLHFSSSAVLLLAIVVLYLTLLVSVERGVLRGTLEFAKYNRSVVTEAVLRLLLGVPLLYAFGNAGAAVGGYAVALLTLLPLATRQAKATWKNEAAEPVPAAEVLKFGSPMFVFTIASAAFVNLDMLLVKSFFSGIDAGLYGGAITLARSIAFIYGPFGILLLPAFVSQGASGPPPFRMVLRVVGYFLAAAALPLAAFALWPEEILTLAFGEAFGAGTPLLLPLAGAAALAGLSALIGNALAGLGEFRFLGVYLGGLLLLVSGLLVWHDSLDVVAMIVLVAQSITAAAMLLLLLSAWRASREVFDAEPSIG